MFAQGMTVAGRIRFFIVATIATVAFPVAADSTGHLYTDEKVTLGINAGVLSGQTHERVYEPEEGGRKVSQLDWKYSNAAVIKGSLDWNVLPWMSLGASGWTTITSTDGYMNDDDWVDASQSQWTDRSVHPDTTLRYANEFDLNFKGWLLNEPAYRLGLMAGYQERRFSFTSKGGSFSYNNGAYTGEFPADVTIIGYKQHFKTPYVGLAGGYRYKRFDMAGAFKYSRWASATDVDEHYLADKTFVGKTKHQQYYSLGANLGYFMSANTNVFVESTWSRTRNKKGNLTLKSRSDNYRESYDDSAGIESSSVMTTIGLKHVF
ncbi:omptin family outer membrane protease [Pseudomonas sp. B21-056]|jgi:omptin|uniref:omptin family outer membrane protease n=1 Tax=Pseudomonas sp. B21-056 TaxID=2895495 RepID=UPI00222E8013|nr:omptin family outer membrane protease [Pseudomonas sp. B21-056]UZE24791.1 omptin family outer membrane protease [Pseudomonas sp. B21-056]